MVPFFPFHAIRHNIGPGLPCEPLTRKEKFWMCVILIPFLILVGWLFYESLFVRINPSYMVTGTIQHYDNSRYLFTKYVKVTVKLEDGHTMVLDTNMKPQRCNYAPVGSTIRISILPVDHAIFDTTKIKTFLVDNPCY